MLVSEGFINHIPVNEWFELASLPAGEEAVHSKLYTVWNKDYVPNCLGKFTI